MKSLNYTLLSWQCTCTLLSNLLLNLFSWQCTFVVMRVHSVFVIALYCCHDSVILQMLALEKQLRSEGHLVHQDDLDNFWQHVHHRQGLQRMTQHLHRYGMHRTVFYSTFVVDTSQFTCSTKFNACTLQYWSHHTVTGSITHMIWSCSKRYLECAIAIHWPQIKLYWESTWFYDISEAIQYTCKIQHR